MKCYLRFAGVFLLVSPLNIGYSAGPPPDSRLYQPGPMLGHIDGGCIYSCRIYKRSLVHDGTYKTFDRSYFPELHIVPFQPHATRRVVLFPAGAFPGSGGLVQEGANVRWRIAHGSLWSTTSPTNGYADAFRVKLTRLSPANNFTTEFFSLSPVREVAWAQVGGGLRIDWSVMKDAHYDVVPQGKSGLMVILAWKGELRLWPGSFLLNKKNEMTEDGVRWDNAKEREGDWEYPPARRLRTDIREAFIAFDSGDYYFFVTVSGQVHCCTKKGNEARTKLLWNDVRRPVQVLLTDGASGRTFAFAPRKGSPLKDVPDVYFPLEAKLVPAKYGRPQVAGRKDDPPNVIGAYARFLLTQRKITLPEKK